MLSDADEDDVLAKEVARFVTGDPTAMRSLVERFEADLEAFTASRVPGGVTAEDVSQDTFARAWQSRDQFKGGNFKAWLFTIAKNKLKDLQRRRKSHQLPEDFDLADRVADDEDPRLDALKDCIKLIKKSHGDLLQALLLLMNGRSTAEIAEELNIALGTVGSRCSRAKDSLKTCVENTSPPSVLSSS